MAYEKHNLLMKNARLTQEQSVALLRYFLRGYSASRIARVGVFSKPTVLRVYERARLKLFHSREFQEEVFDNLLLANLEGWIYLSYRVHHVENAQLLGCVYYCDTSTPPQSIRTKLLAIASEDRNGRNNYLASIVRSRRKCTYCPLKLCDYRPGTYPAFTLNFDQFPPAHGELVRTLQAKPHPSDAIVNWALILFHLANYRRAKQDKDIYDLFFGGLLGYAIASRDRVLPKGSSIPHAIDVPPAFSSWTVSEGEHIQNDIETRILARAVKIIRDEPL